MTSQIVTLLIFTVRETVNSIVQSQTKRQIVLSCQMICYFKIRPELFTGIFQYSVIFLYIDDFAKCSTVSSSCFTHYRSKCELIEIAFSF